jgi:GT2 family glycosyltransferase
MRTELSILIVNWNTKNCLSDCLKSVYNKVDKAVNYEIIVVDNASSDKSADMIKGEFPKVKLIVNKENIGFGRACNQAAKAARGKYLLLLNPDTAIIRVNFKEISGILAERTDIGAIVPVIYSKDGNLKYNMTRTIPKIRDVFNYYILHNRLRFKAAQPVNANEMQVHEYPSGSCFLIKKTLFQRIGGFDEHYFLFFEDADLGVRLNKYYLKTISLPAFRIIHIAGKSTEQNTVATNLSGHQSTLYFFRKTHGIMSYIAIKFILIVGTYFVLVSLLIKWFMGHKIRSSYRQLIANNLNIIKWHFSHTL